MIQITSAWVYFPVYGCCKLVNSLNKIITFGTNGKKSFKLNLTFDNFLTVHFQSKDKGPSCKPIVHDYPKILKKNLF